MIAVASKEVMVEELSLQVCFCLFEGSKGLIEGIELINSFHCWKIRLKKRVYGC